jgi:hypothetical protein
LPGREVSDGFAAAERGVIEIMAMKCGVAFLNAFVTAIQRTQEFRKNFAKMWQVLCGNVCAVSDSDRPHQGIRFTNRKTKGHTT